METLLPLNVSQIPMKNQRLFRSVCLIFIDWYRPKSKTTVFDMSAYVLSIVSEAKHQEIGLLKPYQEFGLNFSHRRPHEIAIKMSVEFGVYSDTAYSTLDDKESILRGYFKLLKRIRSENIFKRGIVKTLKDKIEMELLIQQTIILLKYLQNNLLIEAKKNIITDNLH